MVFPGGRVKVVGIPEGVNAKKKVQSFQKFQEIINWKSRGLTSKTRFPGHGERYNAF